jgi:hypothetical protein
VVESAQRTYITLDLSPSDFREYYNGFANRVLWPILHYRVDLAEFTAVDLGRRCLSIFARMTQSGCMITIFCRLLSSCGRSATAT